LVRQPLYSHSVDSVLHSLGLPQQKVKRYISFLRLTIRISGAARRTQSTKGEPLHVLVDATGIKIYGEGKWKVRTHGVGKRRTWRKLHIAMNAETAEILAWVATSSNVSDKEVLPLLLEQIQETIKQLTGDGGYDYATCYEAIGERKARAVILPRRRGRLHPEDERLRARDKNLRSIRKVGRSGRSRVGIIEEVWWKQR
jgi:hypothetical protein